MTTELKWMWYASADGEYYNVGPEASREAVIQAAIGDEIGMADDLTRAFCIVESCKIPLQLADYFDADAFVDSANESTEDIANPDGDPIFDLSPAEAASLRETVRDAIRKWQADNDLTFMPWAFTHSRNEERIFVNAAGEVSK